MPKNLSTHHYTAMKTSIYNTANHKMTAALQHHSVLVNGHAQYKFYITEHYVYPGQLAASLELAYQNAANSTIKISCTSITVPD